MQLPNYANADPETRSVRAEKCRTALRAEASALDAQLAGESNAAAVLELRERREQLVRQSEAEDLAFSAAIARKREREGEVARTAARLQEARKRLQWRLDNPAKYDPDTIGQRDASLAAFARDLAEAREQQLTMLRQRVGWLESDVRTVTDAGDRREVERRLERVRAELAELEREAEAASAAA